MTRKVEIKLLNKLATLEEYQEYIQNNIYPLAIKLNKEEIEAYLESEQQHLFLGLNESFKKLYSRTLDPSDNNLVRFYLNAYNLREKIATGEVFVSSLIEANNEIKPVDYISESYGYDLDAPRVVFRKRPRVLFRQWDYYDEAKDDITKGEDLLTLAYGLTLTKDK